jgi:hypothetical protein
MANRLDDFGKVSAEAARKLASKQAEAAGRYVAVLSDFGSGKTSVGKYAANLAGFGLRESVKYAETYATVYSDWLQSSFDIISKGAKTTANKAEKAVREAAKPPQAPAK